ncbi:MAG: hypothetical protein KatS3mg125_2163 [Lysobacterales bacterium]|nr:MAG: hypothetical protein KatS3mg125_2163 [Xanthomonadales bacterium]
MVRLILLALVLLLIYGVAVVLRRLLSSTTPARGRVIEGRFRVVRESAARVRTGEPARPPSEAS